MRASSIARHCSRAGIEIGGPPKSRYRNCGCAVIYRSRPMCDRPRQRLADAEPRTCREQPSRVGALRVPMRAARAISSGGEQPSCGKAKRAQRECADVSSPARDPFSAMNAYLANTPLQSTRRPFQDVTLLGHTLEFGLQSLYLRVLIQLRLPHDIWFIKLRLPGIQTMRRDAQSLRHIRHRMTTFGYLFDCLNLELIRVPLAARSAPSLAVNYGSKMSSRGWPVHVGLRPSYTMIRVGIQRGIRR